MRERIFSLAALLAAALCCVFAALSLASCERTPDGVSSAQTGTQSRAKETQTDCIANADITSSLEETNPSLQSDEPVDETDRMTDSAALTEPASEPTPTDTTAKAPDDPTPTTTQAVKPDTLSIDDGRFELRSKLDEARSRALAYLQSRAKNASYGNEWTVISLCTAGRKSAALGDKYLSSVAQTVSSKLADADRVPATALDKHKATENARVILALLAVGADPTNVGGFDLVSALCDVDWVCSGTLNCPIYALIALDACGGGHNAEKNALVDQILAKQLADGGWALSGTNSDPDVTAMAMQALCRHRDRSDVLVAASRAIATLSRLQLDGGDYRSWGNVTSESISQVVIALCAWGIDPSSDPRFTKGETSALDALLGYLTADGFADTKPDSSRLNAGETDPMATEQASLALSAFDSFLSGGGNIYKFD